MSENNDRYSSEESKFFPHSNLSWCGSTGHPSGRCREHPLRECKRLVIFVIDAIF